jgi:hypothetical protein
MDSKLDDVLFSSPWANERGFTVNNILVMKKIEKFEKRLKKLIKKMIGISTD